MQLYCQHLSVFFKCLESLGIISAVPSFLICNQFSYFYHTGSTEDNLRLMFNMYDTSKTGTLSQIEFITMLK